MPPSPLEYVRHILDECEYLLSESKNFSYAQFIENATVKRAFVRSVEIIGEASKKVSSDLKNKYPAVEWRAMAGMRDRLIHNYFGVDYDIVWDVVITKIPILQKQMMEILDQES